MKARSWPVEQFLPTASWSVLRHRADLLRQLRAFFETRGFVEIETPLLSSETVIDRHIEPIEVTLDGGGHSAESNRTMWLQTSPEFCMKRLLAAGGEAIFQIAKAFRAGEQGTLHNVEFTMVEWYRVGDTMADGIHLLDQLAMELLGRGSAERLSCREAFLRHVSLDPHTADPQKLIGAVRQHCAAPPADGNSFDRDAWLNLLLVDCIEPHLGRQRPTILYDYPASQAALAIVRNEDPPVAERFELYVDGIELANGYHELLDPDVLLRRNRVVNEQRAADNRRQLPEPDRLLRAMQHGLPPCTGVALGFDRLVMVATGAQSIRDVMAFPSDRA